MLENVKKVIEVSREKGDLSSLPKVFRTKEEERHLQPKNRSECAGRYARYTKGVS